MSPRKRKRADTEDFSALAWLKFNAFSLEERIAMLREAGIPADVDTVDHYFSQLVETAIEQNMKLLGADWPGKTTDDLLKKV